MSTTKIFICAAALTIAACSTRACLNEYKNARKANPKTSPTLQAPPVNWTATEESLRQRAFLENSPYKVKSDYAVALLHLGRTREALQILEPLAKKYTNEYQIMANLGTAYELDGQLEPARKNIARAMEIKPTSHQGTEWLHVKILEAKIALAKDPNWLATHSVLGHDFGSGPRPVKPATLKTTNDVSSVTKALVYQLTERLQFVRPPDPTVADLLYDLGNIYAISGLRADAARYYQRSLQYGDLRKPIITTRLTVTSPASKGSPHIQPERKATEKPEKERTLPGAIPN
jgi:tetratricopeptide (TPR) repeat protein